MKNSLSRQFTPHRNRNGFTLVELLVATGLIILMMSMFTVVFQLASGSMSTQRGIATNDQRARSVSTILRDDLKARTFRVVVPFAPGETDPGTGTLAFDNRKGYLYISENNLNDKSDDVLQFTVFLGTTGEPYYGKANPLGVPETAPAWQANTPYTAGEWVEPTTPNGFVYYCQTGGTSDPNPMNEPAWPTSPNQTVPDNGIMWRSFRPWVSRNQPEWDDGEGGNNTGSSPAAEITYFLRNGILYRRVLLIRQPLETTDPKQPQYSPSNPNAASGDFFASSTPGAYSANRFWRDFDFSARYEQGTDQVKFNGIDGLDNGIGTGFFPLAHPANRFGFSHSNGMPKEYLAPSGPTDFIGRFTLEEVSHQDFQYPHKVPAGGNPLSRTDLTMGPRQTVNEFLGGPRRGEDALMMNVLSFDIKVWDEALGRFVDVGHNLDVNSDGTPDGIFNQANNAHVAANLVYGPTTDVNKNRIFDTWHPELNIDGAGGNDPAPFRPTNAGNPLRMRSLQITIEYLDVNSDQVRQITVIQSLM